MKNEFAPIYVTILLFLISTFRINIIEAFGWEIPQVIQLGISVFVAFGFTIYQFVVTPRARVFKEGTKKFNDFFSNWYRKSGKLIIFCTDLDWIDQTNSSAIKNSLIEKSSNKKLTIYLKDDKNPLVNILKTNGAEVKLVGRNLKTKHRFSIVDDGLIQHIIIRNVDGHAKDAVKIEFVEANSHQNPFLISVALDMLEDL
jgi:hypothetical protein